MTITVSLLLAAIALICGILMLVGGRFGRVPLAAIAIICLAINQLGIIK
jgi:hypothetical protein